MFLIKIYYFCQINFSVLCLSNNLMIRSLIKGIATEITVKIQKKIEPKRFLTLLADINNPHDKKLLGSIIGTMINE